MYTPEIEIYGTRMSITSTEALGLTESTLIAIDNSQFDLFCGEDQSCSNNQIFANQTDGFNTISMILDSDYTTNPVGSAPDTIVRCDESDNGSNFTSCNITCLAPNAGANMYV